MRRNGRYEISQTHVALVLCVLIHIALFLLLRDALRGPMLRAPSDPIVVTLIESIPLEPSPELQVPPFAAQAATTTQKTPLVPRTNISTALISAAAQKSATPPTPALPNAQQLIESMAQAAAEIAQRDLPGDRGFLTHRKAKLPSSDQAIVAGIQLRKQTSLKTLVQGVTKGLHGAFACSGGKHASLNSEKLIASPIVTLMDNHFDIGPDNEDCMPEK
ncbi:hypothetical protein ELE36_18140 [Pseudolysobacter antarcticus]|uniref:Uncharacterized protein n=1 Tax=Pseudolysobacter antarcticus TaxID=2511995 RepID=A0A411HNY8_9GAMM|nr:hypothetical protein [Pseudolysobacter antarcticus]QBB72130.1 hypothetical protein ELE36_18140 [Pseudolysobacter antarcticus]